LIGRVRRRAEQLVSRPGHGRPKHDADEKGDDHPPIAARGQTQCHATFTGAQHERYHVLDDAGVAGAVWPRINGW
jgi:hypothetical protein